MFVYLKKKATVSYSPLKMCIPARNVCVCYGCETCPLPVYPIVFQHTGLPVGGKHSVFNFIHRHMRSFLLVSLNWQPACASSLRRRGRVKKTIFSNIQYFEFGLQYLVQPLGVNPTYSTFKGSQPPQEIEPVLPFPVQCLSVC